MISVSQAHCGVGGARLASGWACWYFSTSSRTGKSNAHACSTAASCGTLGARGGGNCGAVEGWLLLGEGNPLYPSKLQGWKMELVERLVRLGAPAITKRKQGGG